MDNNLTTISDKDGNGSAIHKMQNLLEWLNSRTDALEWHFVLKIRLELRLLSVVKQGGVNFYALQVRRMPIFADFPNKHD